MAIEDDDKPRKKITHEIGQDLSLLSVEELTERIALLNSEIERLQQAAPRLFVAMLGGGAGTFASLGKHGPLVQAGIGKHLGMGSMKVPSRLL